MKRPETGNMRFLTEDGHEDWTGVFIRGDDAFAFSVYLSDLLENNDEPYPIGKISPRIVKGLLDLLQGSDERKAGRDERPEAQKAVVLE